MEELEPQIPIEDMPDNQSRSKGGVAATYGHPDGGEINSESVEVIAGLLTKGAIETLEHFEEVKALPNKEQLRDHAEFIVETISGEATSIHNRLIQQLAKLSPEQRQSTQRLMEAIDSGDEEAMKNSGFTVEYAWFDDIVATMLQGHPPLEIETVSPYAFVHVNPENGELEVDKANIPPREMAGILASRLIRIINPGGHNARIVSLMDEFSSDAKEKPLTPEEQARYVKAMYDFYLDADVLMPEDKPGEDFILLRESELAEKVDDLIIKLEESGNGEVVTADNGEVIFMPNRGLVDKLALHSRNRVKEFNKKGILLRRADGTPTCPAMDAAGFLNPINKKFMHVVMQDRKMAKQQDQVYAMLRSIDTVRQERYHNIFFDSEHPPEVIEYALAKIIQTHTENFLKGLDAYDEWEKFDPYEYVKRNYGEAILPEDSSIIETVIRSLERSGVPAGSLEHVAEIGSGPNLYPLMLVTPYMKPGARAELLEFTKANRDYLQKVVDGEMEGEHAEYWHKFADLMQKIGGGLYSRAEERAKDAADIKPGSIFELEKNKYDLISSYFVAESIVDTQRPFREAIESMSQALKSGGIMVVAHMVGSEGYHAGEGTHFPAVSLSIKDLEETYKDAGLEFELSSAGGEEITEKAREGYHGMAVVVARKLADTVKQDA
ncbi:MAG: hypothetical protein R3313_02615 [Candidatus Saccharimonadales bacterium]|nr:hypothetical protein [Candidatus Saccharimonadales bacterium]